MLAHELPVRPARASGESCRYIVLGPVSTQVTLEIAPRLQIVATITTDSAKSLNLTKGSQAYGIIKASSVMIGMD